MPLGQTGLLDPFLSCLFGSEDHEANAPAAYLFLSCLFGSEVGTIAGKPLLLKACGVSVLLDPFFHASSKPLIFGDGLPVVEKRVWHPLDLSPAGGRYRTVLPFRTIALPGGSVPSRSRRI